MCGRYYLKVNNNEIAEILLKLKEDPDRTNMRYKTGEIFPTDTVPIITSHGITLAKWGFPRGNKKDIIINARLETLHDRIMFRDIVDIQRCIVPASAYFEWKKTSEDWLEKGRYIIEKDDSILYMAGLYDSFSETAKQMSLLEDTSTIDYLAFTIITKDANETLSNIHHRMPLILKKKQAEAWIKGSDMGDIKSDSEKGLHYTRYIKE